MQATKVFVQRHAVPIYFSVVLLISWGAGLLVEGPKLIRHQPIQPTDALLLFPIIVVSVAVTGIGMISSIDSKRGVQDLLTRMGRWRVNIGWYAVALFSAPALILVVLFLFSTLISPIFTPKLKFFFIVFGIFPGVLEEIGWTGFAYPRMRLKHSALGAGVLLGVLWGLWHAPVVDYLGGAAPHGQYWLPFFLSFIAIVTALRILIVWVYTNTNSVLLAQLMHSSLTASLAVLGPASLTPGQETLWYAAFAGALWIAVAIVVLLHAQLLMRRPGRAQMTEI